MKIYKMSQHNQYMSFPYFYQQSNGSLTHLQGKVVRCLVDQVRGNRVLLKTGLKDSVVCLIGEFAQIQPFASPKLPPLARQQDTSPCSRVLPSSRFARALRASHQRTKLEMLDRSSLPIALQQKGPLSLPLVEPLGPVVERFRPLALLEPFGPPLVVERFRPQLPKQGMLSLIGIDHGEQFGELKFILPKRTLQLSRRKLVWIELTSKWRSSNNRVRGFVVNSVKGGYAVAIAGYIAFLPRSLRIEKKVFVGQWRLFSILNMNARLRNIVVKEIKAKASKSYRTQFRLPTSSFRFNRGPRASARYNANANISCVEANSKHKASKSSSQRTMRRVATEDFRTSSKTPSSK